jgi:hypothetical protein
MQKILSEASLQNKELRERTDISPLIKTAIWRYYFSEDRETFKNWFYDLLDDDEREEVRAYLGFRELK